ncbi:hypothetical protein [Bradyrhizobium sp. 5.13L]
MRVVANNATRSRQSRQGDGDIAIEPVLRQCFLPPVLRPELEPLRRFDARTGRNAQHPHVLSRDIQLE